MPLELEVPPLAALVTSANVVAKLPFFAEMDVEALLATFREKFLPKGTTLTKARLLDLFLGACPAPPYCAPLASGWRPLPAH
jgi:hypothetical protein